MRYVLLLVGLIIGFSLGFALRPAQKPPPVCAPTAKPVAPVAKKSSECDHDASTFRCVKFLRNYDGDTVTFEIPHVHPIVGRNISIRVYGIDTPEIRGKAPCEKERAKEARDLVKSLLEKAKRIDLRNIQRDKYFRILAEVEYDGTSLSEKLLKAKLAYLYDGGTKSRINWCQLASRP